MGWKFTGLASEVGSKISGSTDDFLQSSDPMASLTKLVGLKSGLGSVRGPTALWMLGDYALDKFFFNAPALEKGNFLKVYPYEFVIHDGKQSLLRLRLPIAPSNITINVPVASVTTVTMKGITEDNNGAPLRKITISGTTGIRPVDGFNLGQADAGWKGQVEAGLKYLFKNTVQSVNRAAESANRVARSFFTDRGPASPITKDESSMLNDYTGFEIIHVLQRFFDIYLSAKKSGKNAGKPLFLSFNMYKDQMYYDCTLNSYDIKKSAGTLETGYTVALTAWRRRSEPIGSIPSAISRQTGATTFINPFARITTGLRDARSTLSNVYGVLKGINSDVDNAIIRPLNQAILLAGSLANMPFVAMDFVQSFDNTWRQAIKSSISDAFSNDAHALYGTLNNLLKGKGIFSGGDPSLGPAEDVALEIESSDEPPTGNDSLNKETADPINDIVKFPMEYNDFYNGLSIDQLSLPEAKLADINAEIQDALSLTDQDISDQRQVMDDSVSVISDFFGGGSVDYNRVNGRETIDLPGAELTVERIKILSALNDISIAMDELAVRLKQTRYSQSEDYAQFYKNYALTQGIDFKENTSKFYIPFPVNATLETVAVQYLNDMNRWIELAAINGLKEPYIDEIGRYIDLSISGAESIITIANIDNLYVGQVLTIQSDTQRPEKRKIKAIDSISTIEHILTLSGEPDLNRFTTRDNAKIHVYLPNTVNSNMLIAIPSSVPVNVPGSLRINPDSAEIDLIARMALADFMLQISYNGEADIAFIGNDIAIARGYHNLVQAANIKVLTQRGDLLNDPTFGNPVSVGNSVADTTATEILDQLADMFNEDSRFSGLIGGRVRVSGGATVADLIVGINGTQAYLPFTTALPK